VERGLIFPVNKSRKKQPVKTTEDTSRQVEEGKSKRPLKPREKQKKQPRKNPLKRKHSLV